MRHECSLPSSQYPASCPYPESHEATPYAVRCSAMQIIEKDGECEIFTSSLKERHIRQIGTPSISSLLYI